MLSNLADGGFDLGPLTWVKDEIDQALEKGLASLADFASLAQKGSADKTPLKQAQSQIHQAAGAVQIVGLDGPITLLEEVERHLLLLESAPRDAIPATIDAIGAASRRLSRYLDDLAHGVAPVTLKLYPEYLALCRLRGHEAVSPTDLFFPDLSRAPRHLASNRRPRAHPPAFVRNQRRLFQQGLLVVLKGDLSGVQTMQQAVQALEEALTGTGSAPFWWTVGGFLATVVDRDEPPSNAVKQLCARIDLQIRRFIDGSTKVSDRLRREVLYHIATTPPTALSSPRAQEIVALYQLHSMLPAEDGPREIDIERIRPAWKRSQELIAAVQEQWLRYTAGRREVLPALTQSLDELDSQVRALGVSALEKVAVALKRVIATIGPENIVSDPVAMEFATAVLLVSDALGQFTRLSPDFPRQSDAMCRRLDLAQRGVVSLPGAGEDLLDETARRAQERLLLASVAREIQANLRHVEKVLDAFFRDPAERSELASLARYTGQIRGALQILALNEASALLDRCQKQIDGYAAGHDPKREDLERLAESLSGLGFYIEAVEQQRPDAARMLEPFFRSAGADAAPAPVVSATKVTVTESIESDLEAHRGRELPATVARLREAPDDPALRAELNNQLQTLKQDADLVADLDFSSNAASAIEVLHNDQASTDQVLATLDHLTLELPAEAPAPSAETRRLLAAGDAKFDLELSDIFVTEAKQVLLSFDAARGTLGREPGNVDALREIRRGFHTLKGSGRMVGQLELGESAWRVEKLLNRWLDDERPVTPAVLGLLDDARKDFARWVGSLASSAMVVVDDRALSAAIERIERGERVDVEAEAAARGMVAIDDVVDDGALPLIEPVTDVPPAVPEATIESEITIGAVRLSAQLYETLVDETGELMHVLERERSTLQFDPGAKPTAAMVRAAHTLHGIHRTAGFGPIADTAQRLESTLSTLVNAPRRPGQTMPVVAEAIESLNDLADFVGMRRVFDGSSLDRAADARMAMAELQSDATADVALPMPPVSVPVAVEVIPPPIPAAAAASTAVPLVADDLSTPAIAVGADPVRERIDALQSVTDEIDPELARIFLDEANELFPRAGALLRDWRRMPSSQQAAGDLKRTLHTMKGSARMAGAMRLGELAHMMETRLELLGDREPDVELLDTLDADLDSQAVLIEALQHQPTSSNVAVDSTTEAPSLVAGIVAAVRSASDELSSTTGQAQRIASQPSSSTSPPLIVPSPSSSLPLEARPAIPASAGERPATQVPAAAETPPETAAPQHVTVRVRADIIDRLVNETGEVSIARARIEGELRALKSNLLELTNSVIRLRGQVREIEMQAETQIQSRMSHGSEAEAFDPLEFDRFTRFQELSRSLAEGVNDVATVQQALIRNLDDADAALMAQARLSRDVQQQLLAVRTVPFASVTDRLYRVLRQTAKELGKKVNLDIRGGQTELDRGVLDKLMAPLEHLLRNAIDHGIEAPHERARFDKADTGEIAITVRQEGNEISLTLTDDGHGLPLAGIKAKAIELGLMAPDAQPSDAQLIDAIFTPGFSTAQEVSRISGRGIGMDVVRNEIHALGGRIEVATTEGKGSIFTLYLPLTLAVTQAVLVRAGGRMYALPSALVEQVQQVKADNLIRLYASGELDWQTRTYPFHYLPQLLGDSESAPDPQRYNPVLLLKSANQHVAIHVDEMVGNQEIVIKNIGAQLARLPGLAGATVLGTGEIVLILNPVQLLARHAKNEVLKAAARAMDPDAANSFALAQSRAAATRAAPTVLVVDDSLTVRKITTRLLAREGYEVASARDGVDALQWLADASADIILLDIEMPRMDGFEFAKNVRNDPRLASIPIIMITSRTADKHRARAAELGIEAYLGKPYQEDDLLRQIRILTSKTDASTAPSLQEAASR